MALLSKLIPPIWGSDPAVPDPGDDVAAAKDPTGIRKSLQEIYSRAWSIATGAHSVKRILLDGVGQVANASAEVLRVVGVSLLEGSLKVEVPTIAFPGIKNQFLVDDSGIRVGIAGDTTHTRVASNFVAFTGDRLSQASDIKGTACAQNLLRARGVIQLNRTGANTAELVGNPIGIASVSIVGSYLRVVLAGTWTGGLYQVEHTIQVGLPNEVNAPSGVAARAEIFNRQAKQFDIAVSPDPINSTTKYEIGLSVYDAP